MILEEAERHTFAARLDCNYLLHVPKSIDERTLLALTLHGFGSNPEVMLRLTRTLLGEAPIVASLQAPSQFFLPGSPDNAVGYCWATHAHSDSSVRLHHDMLFHLFGELAARFGTAADRRLLVGFSQPVGMNYRFAATHPEQVRGVIGLCGGMPKNWEQGEYRKVSASLLHIARREDEIYPPEVTGKYAGRLRHRADDVEYHLLDGGHKFPSKANSIVERWIDRVFYA